ncbi:cytochrome c1 [Propylenella binzhouense]|uniref:Cytochrome c1 n=1 Tax=Propylenella binzhouense TaxID=2555902 RepID=A0A964T1S1_9HYPH|nr:cytochrome c1 [Propylenella binzhouense]MYZ46740.1 cytochrome c1 [Propylenella binzhouense]
MKTIIGRTAAAALLSLALASAAGAQEQGAGGGNAGGEHETATVHYPIEHPKHVDWTFAGPFGSFDPAQLQRGFQVYREVCSACHSMNMVAFRTLASTAGPHFSADAVKALAAEYQINDGPDANGDMFQRPGTPADHLPPPYPNEQASRAANGGAYPPDLSLIAKARTVERGFPAFVFDMFTLYQEAGPNYIYSLLTGYRDPPAGVEVRPGQYYNPYFVSGPALAMPPPLSDGQVTFAQNQDEDPANDVPETVDQYAKDVVSFLMWAAEPHMVERKSMGFAVMVFLIVFGALVYYTKRKVWATIEH